eukprot:CAMPEP_0170497882 /NCGR_PEP_ID=MMETSP0208-20121228/26118_1 /TAXON_ID=197538 /ORGANISM="Strombidium inclinatum, Strain S3" /LENGTH=131 /DNA_ID=CAMNT_0010774845 /DNA_START=430 /DNA_END=825 /DNA_ORIENTATION=+
MGCEFEEIGSYVPPPDDPDDPDAPDEPYDTHICPEIATSFREATVNIPFQMDPIETYRYPSYFEISWTIPTLPASTTIERYEILFRTKDGSSIELQDCLGCDEGFISRRYCYVYLTTLWDHPMNLEENDLV